MGCYEASAAGFDDILARLRSHYRVWAPVSRPGRGAFSGSDLVTYGEINSLAEIVWDRQTV